MLGRRPSGITRSPEIKKCFHYLIDYSCSRGRWTQHSTTDKDPPLKLDSQAITRLNPLDGKKSLGLHTCPSGSMAMQKEALLKNVISGSIRLRIIIFLVSRCGLVFGIISGHLFGGALVLSSFNKKSSISCYKTYIFKRSLSLVSIVTSLFLGVLYLYPFMVLVCLTWVASKQLSN